jgi:hypothetical protein
MGIDAENAATLSASTGIDAENAPTLSASTGIDAENAEALFVFTGIDAENVETLSAPTGIDAENAETLSAPTGIDSTNTETISRRSDPVTKATGIAHIQHFYRVLSSTHDLILRPTDQSGREALPMGSKTLVEFTDAKH